MEAIWNDVASRTKKFAKKPERFLLKTADSDDFEKSKILLKVFYDGVKLATSISDTPEASQKTLSELIIEDFDEDATPRLFNGVGCLWSAGGRSPVAVTPACSGKLRA